CARRARFASPASRRARPRRASSPAWRRYRPAPARRPPLWQSAGCRPRAKSSSSPSLTAFLESAASLFQTWHMRKAPGSEGQDPLLLRRLLRAKDRMDAASHEAWPVARLAGVSGVSAAHFARAFKQAFGAPPHRYLLTRRIERASALLRDTDLPIIDIAFDTGWNSLGTFGRTFRDITGESPSVLRARSRAEGHALTQVPHCFVRAAQRPHLK